MKKENTIDVMIECPKGSHYKLAYEAENHQFRLSKILPAGLVFPFDFGMIPRHEGRRWRSAGRDRDLGTETLFGMPYGVKDHRGAAGRTDGKRRISTNWQNYLKA